MLYSYSFADRKRDLGTVLSTVIKEEPRFISNFQPAADAAMQKHEWLEDQICGRGFTAAGAAGGVLTLSPADAAKLHKNMLVSLKDSPALFAVSAVNGTSVTVTLAAANGSGIDSADDLPAAGGKFIIVSTPMSEGTTNGDGEENYAIAGSQWNATQIFRKEIVISGSALAVNLYGSADNQLNRQTAFALSDLARDLNRVALFGRRVEPAAGVNGEAGGLYYFAGSNGLEIDAAACVLDSFVINDAAQKVLGEGGEPVQILCSPGQARVISNEYRDRLQILRSDDRRGAYVAVIVNEINGRGMTIMADPDMPDTDVWVVDTACFGIASLAGRGITDSDATPNGFDGIRRVTIGELTFEFRNVKQRCCRIKNLLASTEAIASLRNN